MRIPRVAPWVLVCLYTSISSVLASDNPADIAAKARERMKGDVARKRHELVFNRNETTQMLDAKGKIINTTTETYIIYGLGDGDQMGQKLIRVDGKPLDQIYPDKEVHAKKSEPGYTDDFIDEKFFDRFDFSFASPDTINFNGHPCVVLAFRPKKHPPNVTNPTPTSEAFNLLKGLIYIEKETNVTWYIRGELSESLSKFFGIAGIWKFDFTFEFQDYQGIQVGKSYDILVSYNEPFKETKHEHHLITNDAFDFINHQEQ